MPIKKAEAPHESMYDEQPGMDPSMMEEDATAWRVTPADVQGPGNFRKLGEMAGPYVGDPFSGVSGLGNQRAMITYARGGRGKSPRTGSGK